MLRIDGAVVAQLRGSVEPLAPRIGRSLRVAREFTGQHIRGFAVLVFGRRLEQRAAAL